MCLKRGGAVDGVAYLNGCHCHITYHFGITLSSTPCSPFILQTGSTLTLIWQAASTLTLIWQAQLYPIPHLRRRWLRGTASVRSAARSRPRGNSTRRTSLGLPFNSAATR